MLQRAVELEFATIPAYLCALWSIMDDDGSTGSDLEVYGRIKGIVREEMSHIGLAANLLNSIGGSPDFNSATVVPTILPTDSYSGHTILARRAGDTEWRMEDGEVVMAGINESVIAPVKGR